MKVFRATLVFRESASCSKILNDEKYVFNTVKNSRSNSVFQNKRKLIKKSECKKYIPYNENFQGNSLFQGKRRCSKILNDKEYFNTVKNSRTTLFFRTNASCSKLLNSKKYIQYREKFQGKLCFQGKRKLLKSWIWEVYSLQWKFSGQLCFFSGQAQVAQKSWTVKKFSIQCNSLGGDPCNLGLCSL